jgi:hypothetical protein
LKEAIDLFSRTFNLWLMVALCLPLPAVGQTVYTLDGIRLGQFEGRTRVVCDISGPAPNAVEKLTDPSRIVMTLSDVRNAADIAGLPIGNSPIVSIEHSSLANGALELVFSLSREVDYKIFSLPPNGERGDRVVLDLYPPAPRFGDHLPTVATAGSSGDLADTRFAFSGTWEQEWAMETDGGDSQKFEALVEPRVDITLSDDISITAIARVRLDTVGDLGPDEERPDNYSSINGPFYNDSHAEFSLRELYMDTKWSETHWRIGKQQVVWGQADGIKVLDVVNPQSYREFILDDFDRSRIPLTMVNMQTPVGESSTLQLLWIPDTTYHELAEPGTPYYLTSPLLVPLAPEGLAIDIRNPDVPDNPIEDSDLGGRLSSFVGGWDVTVNYLYHYQDYPVLYQRLEFTPDGPVGIVSPEYERNHMVGGTLSNAFGDFILRAEVAYNTDTFHVSNDIAEQGIADSAELGSVLGLDWTLSEYDTLLSAQWFQSHLLDYQSSVRRGENEQNLSLYYQRDFARETWQFSALALYSIDNKDSLWQLKLEYLWQSNIEIWLGADIFSGDNDGIYGEFSDSDRILVGLRVGF